MTNVVIFTENTEYMVGTDFVKLSVEISIFKYLL